MSWFMGEGYIDANGGVAFDIPIPQDGNQYTLVYTLAGTFVGTLQAQADGSQIQSTHIASTGATEGDPTTVGELAADCGAAAAQASVTATAWTSGSVQIRGVLIPQG